MSYHWQKRDSNQIKSLLSKETFREDLEKFVKEGFDKNSEKLQKKRRSVPLLNYNLEKIKFSETQRVRNIQNNLLNLSTKAEK